MHSSEKLYRLDGGGPGTITADGAPIDRVEDFKYMGAYVTSVGREIGVARLPRGLMAVLCQWGNPVRVETKLRVFKAMVEPVMFYACETWPLTLRRERRLTSHWLRFIRQILNCRYGLTTNR